MTICCQPNGEDVTGLLPTLTTIKAELTATKTNTLNRQIMDNLMAPIQCIGCTWIPTDENEPVVVSDEPDYDNLDNDDDGPIVDHKQLYLPHDTARDVRAGKEEGMHKALCFLARAQDACTTLRQQVKDARLSLGITEMSGDAILAAVPPYAATQPNRPLTKQELDARQSLADELDEELRSMNKNHTISEAKSWGWDDGKLQRYWHARPENALTPAELIKHVRERLPKRPEAALVVSQTIHQPLVIKPAVPKVLPPHLRSNASMSKAKTPSIPEPAKAKVPDLSTTWIIGPPTFEPWLDSDPLAAAADVPAHIPPSFEDVCPLHVNNQGRWTDPNQPCDKGDDCDATARLCKDYWLHKKNMNLPKPRPDIFECVRGIEAGTQYDDAHGNLVVHGEPSCVGVSKNKRWNEGNPCIYTQQCGLEACGCVVQDVHGD
jgi:hypothetical protein